MAKTKKPAAVAKKNTGKPVAEGKKSTEIEKSTKNKAVKVTNGEVSGKPQRLSKEEKNHISDAADGQAADISNEVQKLLSKLKKEQGVVGEKTTANVKAVNSGPKKAVKKAQKQIKVEKIAEQKPTIKVEKIAEQKPLTKKRKNSETIAETPEKTQKLNDGQKANKKKNKQKKNANQSVGENDLNVSIASQGSEAAQGKSPKKKNKKPKQPNEQKQPKQPKQAKQPKKVDAGESTAINENKQKNKENKKKPTKSPQKLITEGDRAVKNEAIKSATPIYVGNLPKSIKQKKLTTLFSKFGKIVSIRIRANDGKRLFQKGREKRAKETPFLIAFVYFETADSAKAALALNGEKIGENSIVVDLNPKKEEKPEADASRTVFLGNLKYAVTDEILRGVFSCCGPIEYTRVLQCDKGCNGTAFVGFKSADAVGLALELNKTPILDREVHVERYSKKKLGGGEAKKAKPAKFEKKNNVSKKKDGAKASPAEGKKKNKEFAGKKLKDKKKANKKSKKLTGMKLLAKKVAPKSVS